MVDNKKKRFAFTKIRNFLVFGVFLLFIFLFNYSTSFSAPTAITYQGKLLTGGLNATTTLPMQFVIYDDPTNTTNPVYYASGSNDSASVNITPINGLFSIDLGDTVGYVGNPITNPIPNNLFNNNSELYLQVIINGQHLSPRKKLTASPYAFHAGTANTSTFAYTAVTSSFSNTSTFTYNAVTSSFSSLASSVVTTTNPSWLSGNVSMWTNDLGYVTSSGARAAISVTANGLVYNSGTGEISLDSGRIIPFTNSTTNWQDTYLTVVASSSSWTNMANLVSASNTFWIDSAGTSGYVWTSDGNGRGLWSPLSSQETVVGSSTVGFVAVYDGVGRTVTGTSMLTVSSTRVGIGTSFPDYTLDVAGDMNIKDGSRLYIGGTSMVRFSSTTNSIFLGNSGNDYSTGIDNYGFGSFVLYANQTGEFNIGIGNASLAYNTSGSWNTAVGSDSLSDNVSGSYNTGFGGGSLTANKIGNYNTAIGESSLGSLGYDYLVNEGNTALGSRSGYQVVGGSYNTLLGAEAGSAALFAYPYINNNTFIGYQSGYNPTTGNSNNIYLGYQSGYGALGSNNIFLGYKAGYGFSGSNTLYIENSSSTSPLVYGDFYNDIVGINGKLGIGSTTPYYSFTVSGTAYISQDLRLMAGLRDSNNAVGSNGNVLLSTGTSTSWVSTNTLGFLSSYTETDPIWVASSSSYLTVISAANTYVNSSSIIAVNRGGTGTTTFTNGGIVFYNGSTLTQNVNKLFWNDASGYLGVGTSSPASMLTVAGTSTLRNLIPDMVGGIGNVSLYTMGVSSSRWSQGWFNEMYIGSSTWKLSQNNGAFNITDSNTTTPAIAILRNNNVGIGTTTPSDKLVLNGGNFVHKSDGSLINRGSVAASSSVLNVFVSGKYAYLNDSGLRIIDISNPDNPVPVGYYPGIVGHGIFVSGKYAYFTNWDSDASLKIVDISNKSNPVLVGSIATPGAPDYTYRVFVSGRYAYVAAGVAGIQIIDIAVPSAPRLVGSYAGSGVPTDAAYDIYVSGKYAYVAAGTAGIKILNITNSSAPSLVGSYDTPNSAYNLYVVGKYAYVADGSTMQILDISNPASLVSSGSVGVSSSANDIFVSGQYAYVGTDSGVDVIDVSNSTNPRVFGHYNTDSARGLYVSGKYAYVADYSSFKILDINGVETPAISTGDLAVDNLSVSSDGNIVSNLLIGGGLNVGVGGIQTDGAITVAGTSTSYFGGALSIGTYLSTTSSLLTVAGTSTLYSILPDMVGVIGNVSLYSVGSSLTRFSQGWFNEVNIGSANWKMSQGSNGSLQIFNSASPTISILSNGNVGIGTTTPNAPLQVVGNFNNLITPGSNIRQVSTFNVGTYPVDVEISGQYAYVVNENSNNISILDISNPVSPKTITTISSGLTPLSVTVSGQYVYVVNYFNSVSVFNISKPSSPVKLVDLTVDYPRYVIANGKYIYVISGTAAGVVSVFDFSSPNLPVQMATATVGNYPNHASIFGKYLYVASGDGVVSVLDVSNPLTPNRVATTTAGASPVFIEVAGRYAYVVNSGSNTVSVLDVSNPLAPIEVASTSVGSYPLFAALAGRYLYVVNGVSSSISVVDVSNPLAPTVVNTSLVNTAPYYIAISGRYAYIPHPGSNYISIVDINGSEASSLMAHNARVGNLQSDLDMIAQGNISGNSLQIGSGGIFSEGALSIVSTNTPSYFGGSIGIGTSSPEFGLDIMSNGIISRGTFGTDNSLLTTGAGTRMIWYPRKAAFRAGSVNGTQWNDSYIGNYSAALGGNNIASGTYSFATGLGNTAGGYSSAAMGSAMVVNGNFSFGIGLNGSSYTVNSSNVMSIMGGNVGIGTTTPSSTLFVQGTAGGTGAWTNWSDERLKTNIVTIDNALGKLNQMRGVEYDWKDPNNDFPGKHIGFVAQELLPVLPEVVHDLGGMYGVDYGSITALLVNAIKEQQVEIDALTIGLVSTTPTSTQKLSIDSLGNTFTDQIYFKNHVSFDEDTVGQAKVAAGATSVYVKFNVAYNNLPVITATPLDFVSSTYRVTATSGMGFVIELEKPEVNNISFNWHAFGANKLKLHNTDGTVEEVNITIASDGMMIVGGASTNNESESSGGTAIAAPADNSIINSTGNSSSTDSNITTTSSTTNVASSTDPVIPTEVVSSTTPTISEPVVDSPPVIELPSSNPVQDSPSVDVTSGV